MRCGSDAHPPLEDGHAAQAAVEQMEDRGWARAVAVCDEWSVVKAIEFIEAEPNAAAENGARTSCPVRIFAPWLKSRTR